MLFNLYKSHKTGQPLIEVKHMSNKYKVNKWPLEAKAGLLLT